MLLWWSFRFFKFLFVFVLFETNTENEVYVRERHFHWWARDREVAREPESGCRALLPCPITHARRAVSRARATAAQTAKSFRALEGAHQPAGCRANIGGERVGYAGDHTATAAGDVKDKG